MKADVFGELAAEVLRERATPALEVVGRGMQNVQLFSFTEVDRTICPRHGKPPAIMPGSYCSECWSEYHGARNECVQILKDLLQAVELPPTN
jgi:hypothetical protein